jgi:hypothetical protein
MIVSDKLYLSKKHMRLRAFSILFFIQMLSCKAKDTPVDMGNDLKKVMQAYLYNAVNNDSSKVKYRVEDVVYYDDKERNVYECEFTVNMQTKHIDSGENMKVKLLDTTGKMKANISRDLQKVERFY